MNTDPLIRRLRWIMLFAMIVDGVITMLGQPATFWTDPKTAAEGNPVVRYFMHWGYVPFAVIASVYGLLMVAFVSLLPRRSGLIVLLTVSLWHYHGACTWLDGHFESPFGYPIYGACLAAAFVAVGVGEAGGVAPIAAWRRINQVLAGVAVALLISGTSLYLVRFREERLAKFHAHAATQQMINSANFIGQYDAAAGAFKILREGEARPKPKPAKMVGESDFPAFIGAANTGERNVFIIYDPSAFPQETEKMAFEGRIRSALEAAGATVSFLMATADQFRGGR